MKTFFDYIRQINSLLLFGAFVAVAALFIWGFWLDVEGTKREVVAVSGHSGSKEQLHFRLDELTDIRGTDTQMLKLTGSKTKAGLVYSDYQSDTRNVLFLNGDENAAHWLFPTQNNVIHAIGQLYEKVEDKSTSGKETNAKALYFKYSDKDTTGDGEITQYDKSNLGLSRASGEGFVRVLSGIDHLYWVSMRGEETISVLYRTGKSLRHVRYSAATLAKESDLEIVAIPGAELPD